MNPSVAFAMVPPVGLEPTTLRLRAGCSNQIELERLNMKLYRPPRARFPVQRRVVMTTRYYEVIVPGEGFEPPTHWV